MHMVNGLKNGGVLRSMIVRCATTGVAGPWSSMVLSTTLALWWLPRPEMERQETALVVVS